MENTKKFLETVVKRTGKKMRLLNKNEKHQLGKIYYCGYWNGIYEVIKIEGLYVTCKWEDGHITRHMTALDRHNDFEVIQEDIKISCQCVTCKREITKESEMIKCRICGEIVCKNCISQNYDDICDYCEE